MADTWTLQTGVSAAESWFGIGAGGIHELGHKPVQLRL